MRSIFPAILITVLLPSLTPAIAQEGPSDTSSQDFQVIGQVPAICSIGSPDNSGGIFDLGILVDPTTGLLRTDLSSPNKKLGGAFCSTRSTIAVVALPMAAKNFTGTPPAGFSSEVNYVATASGWTDAPASYQTGSQANAAAIQSRNTAFAGDITVGVSNFATAGGAPLRLVADNQYLGQVTVTLTAAD